MVNSYSHRQIDRGSKIEHSVRISMKSDPIIMRLNGELEAAERSGSPDAADICLAMATRVLELQLAETKH